MVKRELGHQIWYRGRLPNSESEDYMVTKFRRLHGDQIWYKILSPNLVQNMVTKFGYKTLTPNEVEKKTPNKFVKQTTNQVEKMDTKLG